MTTRRSRRNWRRSARRAATWRTSSSRARPSRPRSSSDLDQGADFAQLATANSIDTGSAEDGGRVGCVDATEFVEPFQTFARTLPIGVVSDPVETEFGWHLIVVRASRPDRGRDPGRIRGGRERGDRRDPAAASSVEIDPRYGRWNPATAEVLPPKAKTG